MSDRTIRRKANAAYVRKDPSKWKHEGWTSSPNSIIRDPDIPPDECWAWSWLASHDDNFEVSGKSLWQAKNRLGRDRAYELLSSLEQRGLLLRYHVFDEVSGVPYIQYDLQPRPVPEEERTWEPPKAKPRKRTHPGSKAARTEPANNLVSAGRDRFLPRQESPLTRTFLTGQERQVPAPSGIPSDQDFPDGAGEGGTSWQVSSWQARNPYKEEKTIQEGERGTEEPAPPRTTPEPSAEAVEMILGLRYGAHRAPTRGELYDLGVLVDDALADGHTLAEIRRYAQKVVNDAATSAVGFLRGGLHPDRLPMPLRPSGGPAPIAEGGDRAVAEDPSTSPGWQLARNWKALKVQPQDEAGEDAAVG